MEDTVLEKCKELLTNSFDLVITYDLCSNATEDATTMYQNAIADIMMHFILIPMVDTDGYESWKREMGLMNYCLGAITEIGDDMNWDINWLCGQYGEENRQLLNEMFKNIYIDFIKLC